ncbi:MAG: hypothetical protein E4G91_09460 [Candidatus Zixiibacteriota bacterium]|nr:MAG: hypothetical protein E4G91_09460 [candidate division Zixibacteria bacterium]
MICGAVLSVRCRPNLREGQCAPNTAWASGKIFLEGTTIELVKKGLMKKGDVLAVALDSASVAGLTIYDMCKAVDKNMRIADIVLTNKTKSAE